MKLNGKSLFTETCLENDGFGKSFRRLDDVAFGSFSDVTDGSLIPCDLKSLIHNSIEFSNSSKSKSSISSLGGTTQKDFKSSSVTSNALQYSYFPAHGNGSPMNSLISVFNSLLGSGLLLRSGSIMCLYFSLQSA